MICINQEYQAGMPAGTVLVVIDSDVTPESLPLNGADVKTWDGSYLGANTHFAPSSILHCKDTGKNYLMNEAGTAWLEDGVPQSSATEAASDGE